MFIAKYILLTGLLAAAAVVAQEGGDIQAQILYAYQTEDSNTLANLIQNLTNQVKNDSGDAALRYHLAHAQYRVGDLLRQRHGREAAAAFSDCIDELKPLLDKNGKSVEALALQSACYAALAGLKSLESVLLRSRAAERLQGRVQSGAAQSARRAADGDAGHARRETRLARESTCIYRAAAGGASVR